MQNHQDTPPSDATFPLDRASALARLQEFLPRAGGAYARLRNHDQGPGQHRHVSRLSAALRRRLISEQEVASAVLAHHGGEAAEKFLSELFWRTYWKGWLEQRPAVWTCYQAAVTAAQALLEADHAQARRLAAARDGRTGIDCFDAWSSELAETGYLHNWARMQFASIWIFTLGLPWELGADLMLGRLIDGDPASNTLSWRWVAGLHTAGKAYLADGERIAMMTGGRFAPKGLAKRAVIPADTLSVPVPSPPRPAQDPTPATPSLLLLTVEDLSLEAIPALTGADVRAIGFLPGQGPADQQALADGLARAAACWPAAGILGALDMPMLDQAAAAGCRQIITGFAPVGPVADRLAGFRLAAADRGLVLCEYRREWDSRAWPHCRRGFFALKEKIPTLLSALG